MRPEHLDLLLDLLVEDRERLQAAGREQAEELAALRDALGEQDDLLAKATAEMSAARGELAKAINLSGRAVAEAARLEAELAAALGELRRLKAPAAAVGP